MTEDALRGQAPLVHATAGPEGPRALVLDVFYPLREDYLKLFA